MLNKINYDNKFFITLAFLTGLAITVTTALQGFSLIIIAIIVLINPQSRRSILASFKVPFVLFCTLLYMMFVIWSFRSAGDSVTILHMLNKMSIYGICSLIFVYYSNINYRKATIYGFFVGAMISLITSFGMFILDKPILLANHGGWSCQIGDWAAFHYHTDHNYFLAWVVIGLVAFMLQFKSIITKPLKVVFIMIATLCLVDIFYLVQGRTGQILCILMLMAVFLLLLSWRRALIANIIIIAMIPLVIHTSAAIECGIHRTTSDVNQYDHGNPDTSVGDRLEYHKYAKELIYKKPIIGYGTGSFKTVYHNLTGFVGDRDPYHPHNDFYWLWVELGFLGPIILLVIAFSLIRHGFIYKTLEAKFLIILSISYLVGALQGGFYTDAITSGAFIVFACILLYPNTMNNLFIKSSVK